MSSERTSVPQPVAPVPSFGTPIQLPIGDTGAHVTITDDAEVVRQLLVDAQVDAIGGAGLT
jgi:hypothetical protein